MEHSGSGFSTATCHGELRNPRSDALGYQEVLTRGALQFGALDTFTRKGKQRRSYTGLF